MNDSWREPVNDDDPDVDREQHDAECVGGYRNSKGACMCCAKCCARTRNNGWTECICERCDGTCGAHLDNGGALATFLFCLAVAFVLGCAVLRGAM